MDLDGFVRVDVLEEPFELNGFRQVIVLFWDAADEKGFRLINGLNFYLREKDCYIIHLRRKQKSRFYNKCWGQAMNLAPKLKYNSLNIETKNLTIQVYPYTQLKG